MDLDFVSSIYIARVLSLLFPLPDVALNFMRTVSFQVQHLALKTCFSKERENQILITPIVLWVEERNQPACMTFSEKHISLNYVDKEIKAVAFCNGY